MVILFSLIVGVVGLGIMCFFLVLFPTILISRVMFGAAGLVVYAQAVAWMLTGRTAVLHEAVAELEGGRWGLFFMIVLVPVTLLVALMIHPAGS